MANDREEDGVGYKRPPKQGQFLPGQSGNPHGRRKNVRNFKTDLLDELREQIPVRENGRERRISKQRAFIKALVAAAIKGDMRATTALVSFCTRSLGGQTDEDVEAAPAPEDIDFIEAFVDRERKRRRSQETEQKPKRERKKVS
jgi:Family of unknown function (DUF5681)